jgi:UDP-GlcNAc:undecaprenyl-phosphate GlcNAc-1-phosphate transferase
LQLIPNSIFQAQPLGFLMALGLTLVLVPLIRRWAINTGRFDEPGERKIHQTPIPRLGGVAMGMGFFGAFALLVLFSWHYPHGNGLLGLLVGGGLFFLLGLLDDLYNLSPYVKLVGQLVAASAAFYCGLQINTLDLPGSKLLVLHGLSYPVTILWLMGLANALNFIDGIDGLAGGVTAISAITLAVIATFTYQPVAALVAALLAGVSLGFLVFNLHPARIFMGDAGALFCGFMLAGVSVTGVLKTKMVVMLLPLLVLMVPILDIVYATFRRLAQGKNPFIADAEHLHHKFLQAGMSQTSVVSGFYLACIVAGMFATGYVNYLGYYLALLVGVVLLMTLLLKIARRGSDTPPVGATATSEDATP